MTAMFQSASTRGRRRGAIAVLAAAVTATVIAHAGTSEAEEDPPPSSPAEYRPATEWQAGPDEQFEDADIDAIAERDGVSRDAAEQRMRVENAAVHVQREARTRWPDTFAGVWIQPTGEPLLFASFTDSAEEKVAELRASYPYPELLRSVTATLSMNELLDLQREMVRDRAEAQAGEASSSMPEEIRSTHGVYDIDIDITTNRLRVAVENPTSRREQAFRARYTQRLDLERGVARDEACTRANCYPSMRGGIEITGPMTCSSGFSAIATTGNVYALSAGHCGGVNSSWANGGQTYGSVTRTQVQDNVDAMRVAKGSNTWHNNGLVWHSDSDQRSIESWISWDSIVVGTNLAKAGRSTGTTLGTVISKNNSLNWVPNSTRFVSTHYCSASGDSGGAVYRDNTAYGIHSGATTVACSDSAWKSFFGPIEYAQTAMNITVLAGSAGDQPPGGGTTTTSTPTTTPTTSPATTTTLGCLVRNPVTGQCVVRG